MEVEGCFVASLASYKTEYKVLTQKGELVTNVDYQRAVGLGLRRLVRCRYMKPKEGSDEQPTLRSLVLAPGVLASQVRNVIKLKPPSMSICNKATVVKVLPSTYTHRSSLLAGF